MINRCIFELNQTNSLRGIISIPKHLSFSMTNFERESFIKETTIQSMTDCVIKHESYEYFRNVFVFFSFIQLFYFMFFF